MVIVVCRNCVVAVLINMSLFEVNRLSDRRYIFVRFESMRSGSASDCPPFTDILHAILSWKWVICAEVAVAGLRVGPIVVYRVFLALMVLFMWLYVFFDGVIFFVYERWE